MAISQMVPEHQDDKNGAALELLRGSLYLNDDPKGVMLWADAIKCPDDKQVAVSYVCSHLGLNPKLWGVYIEHIGFAQKIADAPEWSDDLLKGLDERVLHQFACDCAARGLSQWERSHEEKADPRYWGAVTARRRWLRGKLTDQERESAYWAAYDAAHLAEEAYCAAYRSAYWSAYWSAERSARWSAYWSARWSAERSAERSESAAERSLYRAAERSAEREWQRARLVVLCERLIMGRINHGRAEQTARARP